MAQNELVAAKVEEIARELAERVAHGTPSAVEEVEVWLCNLAKALRAGEYD